MGLKCSLLFLLGVFLQTNAFDTTFDTHQQIQRGWKYSGNFTFANSSSSQEVQQVRPKLLPSAPNSIPISGEFERTGIWLIKHDPSGSNNVWNMTYSLRHLLFAQGWVVLLAHPSVPIIFRSRDNQEVGRFWSDGKGWCDAVFNIGLRNTFTAEVHTPKEGEYALIDKVVLGIMGNITALKNKRIENPCLTSPMTVDTPPDMEVKPETEADNEIKRKTPPDMENKQTTLKTTPPPKYNNGTLSRSYQTVRGGAKCDCVCTCAKPG